ncbi:MAG TPA: 2-amino-4-hydroxy-6-hydroxymethyldihydropteridine diphosphokinase [Vicinamibacterales bacterium]|nr:2-amino-4-hydroxy-6-hydroxymethyldihydropteridine diphosphokinase [Vicinamibacterales bacterium]
MPVAIALGSNLGDRERLLESAVAAVEQLIDGLRVSSWYQTAPVGVTGTQADFLNGAAVGTSVLSARALLDRLLAIEQQFGRQRPFPGAARTLDLDLILYGDSVIEEPGLIVPHPRFRERRFVLEPLAEIAPEWVDPVTGKTVGELLRAGLES